MYKLSFLLITFLSLAFGNLYAVNAKEGVVSVRQPDGAFVNVLIKGNEHRHIVYTVDGYVLVSNSEGFYVFADITSDNEVIPTDIKASNPESRNDAVMERLYKINAQAIEKALLGNNELKRAQALSLPGLMTTYFPSEGDPKALVILVEFSDNEFTVEDPLDFYTRMLNEEDFADEGATGSARDYFISNSSGKFLPQFDVYGPVKLPNDIKYYGANDRWGNDSRPQQMAIDACNTLDEEVDFSIYDTNGDGIIDNVFIYYAGYGEADGGGANTIWPHSTKLSLLTNTRYVYDGVRLDRYACTNELQTMPVKERVDGIGTFCHEFGHVLGLPDLYATTTINLSTPGIWDLMDNGSYNNSGMTPPALSSYERSALGWLEPIKLNYSDYELSPLIDSNIAYIHKVESGNEYFLFENRQQKGWDAYLPGHGMLIWHIDYKQAVWNSNTVNDNIWHQYVDLVEADGLSGIESRPGDAFPGVKNVTEFARWTNPSFSFWDNKEDIPFYIRKIKESQDGLISFSVVPNSFVPDDDEDDDLGEEENAVDAVNISDSYLTLNGMVHNYEGNLSIYDLNGIRVADMPSHSVVSLPSGLYIAVKEGGYKKILIQ